MHVRDTSIIEALAPAEATWRQAAIEFYRSWIEMIASADIGARAPLNAGIEEFASAAISRMTIGTLTLPSRYVRRPMFPARCEVMAGARRHPGL